MSEVRELTYSQLQERFKLLKDKFSSYAVYANIDSFLNPVKVAGIKKFKLQGENDTSTRPYSCFIIPRKYECVNTINVSKEFNHLCGIPDKRVDDIALIIDNNGKTYSVTGVYVDDENKRVVLLNGFYEGREINWGSLKSNVY